MMIMLSLDAAVAIPTPGNTGQTLFRVEPIRDENVSRHQRTQYSAASRSQVGIVKSFSRSIKEAVSDDRWYNTVSHPRFTSCGFCSELDCRFAHAMRSIGGRPVSARNVAMRVKPGAR
jgi:hypothetical protein